MDTRVSRVGLTLGLLFALAGSAAAGEDPFDEVPLEHPAYASVVHLRNRFGAFTGFPREFFVRHKRTRYEFALAVARTHLQLAKLVGRVDPAAAGEVRAVGDYLLIVRHTPPASSALSQSFSDARKIRQVLGWHQALVSEFAPTLAQLGCDASAMQTSAAQWATKSESYSQGVRALLGRR